jgi:hypothetical protein
MRNRRNFWFRGDSHVVPARNKSENYVQPPMKAPGPSGDIGLFGHKAGITQSSSLQ